MPNRIDQDYPTEEKASSLRQELTSGDPKRQLIAAALLRAHGNVRQQARENGIGVIIGRGDSVIEVDPDSPVFDEFDQLIELAEQMFPTKER